MYTDIKTFEDACKALNISPDSIPDYSWMPEKHRAAMVAHDKLIIINLALNEGWEPDWNSGEWDKYFPWFDMETYGDAPKGSGFSLSVVNDCYSFTYASSRLCFRSSEVARYAAETFIDLYKDYYVIPQ